MPCSDDLVMDKDKNGWLQDDIARRRITKLQRQISTIYPPNHRLSKSHVSKEVNDFFRRPRIVEIDDKNLEQEEPISLVEHQDDDSYLTHQSSFEAVLLTTSSITDDANNSRSPSIRKEGCLSFDSSTTTCSLTSLSSSDEDDSTMLSIGGGSSSMPSYHGGVLVVEEGHIMKPTSVSSATESSSSKKTWSHNRPLLRSQRQTSSTRVSSQPTKHDLLFASEDGISDDFFDNIGVEIILATEDANASANRSAEGYNKIGSGVFFDIQLHPVGQQ